MKPYKSGPYLVGNRFLLDLRTNAVSFHCRRTMQLLAQQLPPDLAPVMPERQPVRADPQPLAGGELRPVVPELVPVAADPQPLSEAQRLAVWLPYVQAALEKPAPARGCARSLEDEFWGTSAARAGSTPAQEPAAAPAKPARQWTDSDEALYQEANMWACAVYHWTEGS